MKNLHLLEFLAEAFGAMEPLSMLGGPSENGSHGTEKLMLKTQESEEDFILHSGVNLIINQIIFFL